MTTLAESLREIKKPWQWMIAGIAILLIWAAVALPTLHRNSEQAELVARSSSMPLLYSMAPASADRAFAPQSAVAGKTHSTGGLVAPQAPVERKIVRTSSIAMVVRHPAEITERITALADSLGGYLEASDGGGQDATSATLTIRVPADRFEQARSEIRKLGLNVESEKVNAQDVTRQYVDQEATLRNLRAEEAQYLTILKQATTVKDMLAVSERLSETRGQIEQQQAEFNALSRQVETVAIAISLRTEPEPKVFGLNWQPGYRLKLALRDGLESVGDYAATMTGILFYLPASLLWVGTILIVGNAAWQIVRWMGKRWFGAKADAAA